MVSKLSKFSKKKKTLFENVVAGAVFVVILVGLIGFFTFQNITIGQKRAELENQLADLQVKAADMSAQQQELQGEVADTQTAEYQEKLLREQGLYKKEGEQVVTVLPPEEQSGQEGQEESKERTWWKPWTW